MRKINSVQGQLVWVQPRALKMSYELRSHEELVARMGFRSVLGSFDSRVRIGRGDRDI